MIFALTLVIFFGQFEYIILIVKSESDKKIMKTEP